jgi:hypothetical protein
VINIVLEDINMILFTNKFTRPNANIPFHHKVLDGTSFMQHLTTNYMETQKLISQWKEFSEDKLVMTYKAVWSSKEAFDEHDSDPVLQGYWTQRDIYCTNNNITVGPKSFENV